MQNRLGKIKNMWNNGEVMSESRSPKHQLYSFYKNIMMRTLKENIVTTP